MAALAGLVAGCGALGLRRGAEPPPGRPHLSVACLQLQPRASQGEPCRVVFYITNDGDWPVLLQGITPQRPLDRAVSYVEPWRTALAYDATEDVITAAEPLAGADYHVTVYRGLLLPGEAVRAFTSVAPFDVPVSHHRFRVDYLTAPWETLRNRLYVAAPGGTPRTRVFRRPSSPTRELSVPRLRRAILAGGMAELRAGSVQVALAVAPVAPAPLPLADARRLAGVPEEVEGVHSRLLSGWAFARSTRGVVVVGADGVRRLDHISVEALRAIAEGGEVLSVRVVDAALAAELKDLAQRWGQDGDPLRGELARERLPELLELLALHGLHLDADRAAFGPGGEAARPGALRVVR
ncbi:MAG: hypothetical protein KatS3mg102_0539 [Planctomycetota bacterium]|nr:MAG: hypothetical protein KatS3mg102_0539 [Planctomycetota bacterium]